jgi:drug/metabolite transporter (DMT)-like permease
MHIVGLSVWSPGKNIYALTVIQLFMLAAVSWVGAFSDGSYQAPPNSAVWFAVLFTAIIATSVAFFIQTWAQSIMDASRVAILLTSEVVWAAVVSVTAGQETLGLRTIFGGLCMVAAMLVAEWPSKANRDLAVQPQLID